jgi:serine/threonine-protein kinase HipA
MAFGRIEYAYSQMALAAGITMTECRLLDEGPRRHFVTRRFDRGPAGEKYHIISLCGLAHLDFNLIGAHGYDQYLQTVRLLGLGPDDGSPITPAAGQRGLRLHRCVPHLRPIR